LPADFKLVSIPSDSTVSETLEILNKNGIYSAPLFSSKSNEILGMVDMLDLVTFCTVKFSVVSLSAWESERQMDEFANHKVSDLYDISGRNVWRPVSQKANLQEVIELLSKPNVHRLPIVDDAENVVGIITQSQVVSWLYHNKYMLGNTAMVEKVGDCFLRTEVHGVNQGEFLIEAFKKIWEKNVSAVAVLDNNGKFVGAVSATDLKHTRVKPIGSLIEDLYKPISQFKNIPTTLRERVFMMDQPKKEPVFVYESETIERAMELLVRHRVHRVFVVDSQQRPIGVISLCDLLRVLNTSAL